MRTLTLTLPVVLELVPCDASGSPRLYAPCPHPSTLVTLRKSETHALSLSGDHFIFKAIVMHLSFTRVVPPKNSHAESVIKFRRDDTKTLRGFYPELRS